MGGRTYVKQLGDSGTVCVEVALCSLGNTLTTPRDQNRLGQARIGVLELGEGELDATVRELVKELFKLALCRPGVSLLLRSARLRDLRTSSSLNFQNTLLARVLLEGACERSLDRVDGPLSIGWRVERGRGTVNDGLVALLDRRTVG